jgi:hypothetical protein
MSRRLSVVAALLGVLVTLGTPGTAWAGGGVGFRDPDTAPVKASKEPKQAQVRTCSLCR